MTRGERWSAVGIGAIVILLVAALAVWATDRRPPAQKSAKAPSTTTSTASKGVSHPQPAPAKPAGVLVAYSAVSALPISPDPGAAATQALANPNNLGAPLVLLVASTRDNWVQVYLPQRPNESTGWTPESDVSLTRDTERILVNLTERHIWFFRGSDLVFQTTVAVGSPQSPTPTGDFFVTEVLKITGADNPYGPYALGLSGFSNTYTSFEGGPGQIAIHGTNQPWVVGEYASHGCVRLNNAEIAILAPQVEAGTPVQIVA